MNFIRKILNIELYEIDENEPLWKSALAWILFTVFTAFLWLLTYASGGR